MDVVTTVPIISLNILSLAELSCDFKTKNVSVESPSTGYCHRNDTTCLLAET